MFQDTKQELERLQAQLLEEEEQTAPEQDEDFLDEEIFDKILSDTDQGEACGVYQNYSNNYGRNLRNYASGYKAYNTDKTEISPQQMSQEILQPRKTVGPWLWVVLALMALVVGVIGWLFFSMGGLF